MGRQASKQKSQMIYKLLLGNEVPRCQDCRGDSVSDKASEQIQTLSKNLSCEAITLIPGMFIPNTQSFQKPLLLILSLYFMTHFSDESP